MNNPVDKLPTALTDRYPIERELGRGGMATVYLANDPKHNRKVAVKVMHPAVAAALGAQRFLREIEIAANLTHPHIVPLHDSGDADGVLYYVMPYIEGESLRDRLRRERQLPISDAVKIAREIGDGLAHAHATGVVHRDIKPENILLVGGHAVITDFGIARAITEAGGERLTETGFSLGTPDYMSPEQAVGEQGIDARCDIYALGCVTYEMLTGDPPFTGSNSQAILARKLVEAPRSLRTVRDTIPDGVEQTVLRALASVPADRFATAGDFAEALDASVGSGPVVTTGRRPARARTFRNAAVALLLVMGGVLWALLPRTGDDVPTLAVLPFYNGSGDAEQEYLIAGMHEAVISRLGQITGLRVIRRTSMLRYQGSDKPIPDIARELNVDVVVEGSITASEGAINFEVQLVNALPDQRDIWAQSYEREVDDVLPLYNEVARSIARELDVELTPEEEARLSGTRSIDPETYAAYLRGMFYLNGTTPDDFARGIAILEEAVATDPGDPLAYAGLALGYATLGHGPAPPPDAWPRARAAALRAVTLDSTLAEAHAALADVKLYYEWDWEGAERAFRRANQLNPSLAMNHYHYAWYNVLLGRLDEALAEHREARRLDPLTPLHSVWIPGLYLYGGQLEAALDGARRTLEQYPDHPIVLFVLGVAASELGHTDEAIAAHETMAEVNPFWKFALARTYAVAGRTDDARRIASELEQQPSPWNALGLADIYAALGNADEAFRWLAYEPPHAWLPWVSRIPTLEPLRGDPRFQDLMERLDLRP
jgi:serine/threonine-protein kinase